KKQSVGLSAAERTLATSHRQRCCWRCGLLPTRKHRNRGTLLPQRGEEAQGIKKAWLFTMLLIVPIKLIEIEGTTKLFQVASLLLGGPPCSPLPVDKATNLTQLQQF